jgi:hypothetical protein
MCVPSEAVVPAEEEYFGQEFGGKATEGGEYHVQ